MEVKNSETVSLLSEQQGLEDTKLCLATSSRHFSVPEQGAPPCSCTKAKLSPVFAPLNCTFRSVEDRASCVSHHAEAKSSYNS